MIDPKLKTLNPKSETLNKSEILNPKQYNLSQRTFEFAAKVIAYLNNLPKSISGIEISKQLIRSAGSIGANYLEAEESLSKKDFIMHIKISKKEARESVYWLQLSSPQSDVIADKEGLIDEAMQLMKIFGSIIQKCR